MSTSSPRRSASGLAVKGLQQVNSHLPTRKQSQAMRASAGLDKNPHQPSKNSSPTTFSQNDGADVRSQETSFPPRMSDWAEGVAPNPEDAGQGLIGKYGCLLTLYWDEICAAVQSFSSRSPVPELFDKMDELRQRFRLWNNGEHESDQQLVNSPPIRNLLIKNLTLLTLDLRTGFRLYDPNIQSDLLRQTDACVSQAASLTDLVLPEPREERSPADLIEFLDDEKCQDLKTRVKDIFEILPDKNHPFENFEAVEDQRPNISGIDDRIQRVEEELNKMYKMHKNMQRKLHDLKSPHRREERFSRSAKGGSVHASQLSALANPTATDPSPDLTDSSSDSSLYSDSTSRSSARPVTDTNTSTSTSKVKEPDDPEPYERFDRRQRILIQGRSGRVGGPHPVIFDTGCSESLIISSVVKEYDLETRPLPNGPGEFEVMNKGEFYTNEYVEFSWKLTQGTRLHRDEFQVIDDLPNGLHVLVGNTASEKAGICLRARQGCLVAFRKKNEDTSVQEQRQHTMQTDEGCIRRHQKFKRDQDRHADECKSSETQKSQSLSLHNPSAKNQGYQQTKSRKEKP